MANTKTISGSGSRGYSAYLYLTETGTDVATNKSTISYSLVLYSGNYSFSQYELGWSVYVNGTRVAYQNYSSHQDSISANSSKTLASGTTTVTHDADGSKTISVSAYVDCVYGSYGPGDIDLGSSTWQLTAIPRASSLSVSNGTLGTSQNITITPAVASYTHTLTYTCGSTSGTIASGISGSTSGFTQAWTPPLSLASQNTTGTSVSVTIRCETFYNSTSVGSKSVTVTMAMPASIKPSVSMTLSDAMGYLSTYGAYIQNKSKLGVVVNATTSYGSAISSYSVKIGTRLSYSSGNFTSDVLPESGSISVVVTVTDKRGRSNSATNTITVAAYSAPSITDIGIYRSDSSGNASAAGTYATVTFKASVSPITVSGTNKNTAVYTLKYKLSTASSYSSSALSTYDNNFNVTNGKTTFSAAAANAYDAYITIADKFGTVSSIVVKVQSAATYFKADPANNAFSFGQLGVTANTFTCAWNAVFNNSATFESSLVAKGKYNMMNYYPYSFVAVGVSGSQGYARIATINIVGSWNYSLYQFTVMRIFDAVPINLYLCFSGANTSDPTIAKFVCDTPYGASSNFEAFAYKRTTSTWDIYVRKYSASDEITVYTRVSYFQQTRGTVTYSDDLLTDVPATATKAIPYYLGLLTGTCTTAAATAAKVATVNGGMYFPLVDGTTVYVKFSNTNTAAVASVTLNVNNTGAKSVVVLRNGNREYMPTYDCMRANAACMFTYSDGYWWLMNADSDLRPADYITERGTSGIWTYEKWNSGKAICWGRQAISKSGAWVNWSGGIYLDSWAGTSYSFPSGLFNAVPTFTMTMESSSYMWASPYGATTKTSTPAIVFMRPGGASSFSATLNMHAIGTWK